jgi:hypothetical protein
VDLQHPGEWIKCSMMYRDVQCYGENLSLMAKIDLIVETCGGNCFFLTAIGIYRLVRATSGVLHLWDR